MPIEVEHGSVVCSRCGTAYGRRKGNFPASYAPLYKGIGYLPVCRECIGDIFAKYLSECGDSKLALHQLCRKFDVYWNDAVYDAVEKKNSKRSIVTAYLHRLNVISLIGKSYDDTLIEDGEFWSFDKKHVPKVQPERTSDEAAENDDVDPEEIEEEIDISEDVIAFWGPGYTPAMYRDLEDRLQYWKSKLPDADMDIGTEALLRQICCLEIDINRDRARGRAVDKNMNTLNTLLGSAALKPTQKKNEAEDAALESTPLGVWLYRYENKRPLPEIDDDLKDVNHVLRYVFIWLGHVCKMLGKKNGFSRLYEKEIARYRVERPEFDDEDDEEFLSDVLDEDDELDGDAL